jgi:hypothetical protein
MPAISRNATLKSVTDSGLFTNAVNVLDLAVLLPRHFSYRYISAKKDVHRICDGSCYSHFLYSHEYYHRISCCSNEDERN